MFNSDLASIDSQIARLEKDKAQYFIVIQNSASAPTPTPPPPPPDWSNAPLYSKRLSKIGLITPGEQYNLYLAFVPSVASLGYSIKYFYNSYHLFELTKYKENSEQWTEHWARSGTTNPTQVKLAKLWANKFRVRGVIGLGPPGLLLWFLVSKYRKDDD